MNELIKKTLIVFVILFFIIPLTSFAQNDLGYVVEPEYTLISPLGPGIPTVSATSADSYFGLLFNIFIVVSVILAVIRLMICGIQYMTSEAISSKAAAKSCISFVLGGLLLMLASVIILQTINVDLAGGSFDNVLRGVDGAGSGNPGSGNPGTGNP